MGFEGELPVRGFDLRWGGFLGEAEHLVRVRRGGGFEALVGVHDDEGGRVSIGEGQLANRDIVADKAGGGLSRV